MNITAIKQQLKRTDRYSIFVDGHYAFSLSETALLESKLVHGQALSASQLRQLKKTAGLDKAYNNALRYVALRQRSEWEIRTYLQRKEIDGQAIDHIIARLQAIGFVDDLAFARAWVATRRLLKSTSRRRLQAELAQKHVSVAVIEQALAEDTTSERQVLQELIARKRKQTKYQDNTKLMQYLARQGYSYDDIKLALTDN